MTLRSLVTLGWALFVFGVVPACAGTANPTDGGDGTVGDGVATDAISGDGPTMCATGRISCGASCVDLTSDPANCGGCGLACSGGMACAGGVCGAPCAAPRMMCGTPAMCVDTQTDSANCGSCGRACAMTEMCAAGSCTILCPAPRRVCGTGMAATCVDVQGDPANCGGCGTACPMGVPCTVGACGCNAPFQMCGTSCVNPMTDTTNCGRCGNACGGGTVCRAGLCVCATGQAFCGGRCIDVQADGMNCGRCGNACAAGTMCAAGVCTCMTGTTMCGTSCINLATDSTNCGACGNICGGGTVCTASLCACPMGRTLCGGVCVDTMNDRANCMMCGRACAMGQVCVAGACSTGVDVTVLIDITGSNGAGVTNARMLLPMRLVAPLLALTGVQVGVSYTAEFPTGPYGGVGDRPFRGVIEPSADMTMLNAAIAGAMAMGGGDAPDAMIEGLAPLVGLPVHPTSTALTCSAGRVAGGCWRAGARRFVVLLTDDIFHNGPDPTPTGMMLFSPYTGITPAPAVWPDVLAALRATSTTLLIMNSSSLAAMAPGAPQHARMLADLGQPATDAFIAADLARMGTAADAVVARIRALAGL